MQELSTEQILCPCIDGQRKVYVHRNIVGHAVPGKPRRLKETKREKLRERKLLAAVHFSFLCLPAFLFGC